MRAPATAVAVIIGGGVAGLMWGAVTPGVMGVVVSHERAGLLSSTTVHRFDAIAVFACIAVVYGVAAAIAGWLVTALRGPTGVAILAAVTVAGSALGAWCGGLIAQVRMPGAGAVAVGQYFSSAVPAWVDGARLHSFDASWVILIVAPLAAVISYLFLVLSNPRSDLGADADDGSHTVSGAP